MNPNSVKVALKTKKVTELNVEHFTVNFKRTQKCIRGTIDRLQSRMVIMSVLFWTNRPFCLNH